jgi:hypothetical protein
MKSIFVILALLLVAPGAFSQSQSFGMVQVVASDGSVQVGAYSAYRGSDSVSVSILPLNSEWLMTPRAESPANAMVSASGDSVSITIEGFAHITFLPSLRSEFETWIHSGRVSYSVLNASSLKSGNTITVIDIQQLSTDPQKADRSRRH